MSEKLNLARIEALAAKASEGPWQWESRGDYYNLVDANGGMVHSDGSACDEYSPDIDVNGPDAAFIAGARQSIPALAAKLREARRLLSRLAGLCECHGMPQGAAIVDAFLDSIEWEEKNDGK